MFPNNRVKLGQRIAEVWELYGFKSDPNQLDEVSGLTGVVFMSCGHYFSRSTIVGAIDYQMNTLRQEYFCCPILKSDGFSCNTQFKTQ